MATARIRYLCSPEGGGWTIPAIVNLVQETEEAPRHKVSYLSWRTSGSLLQIFSLQSLVQAHPLTTDPHFTNWIPVEDEDGNLPSGHVGPALFDLTNPTIALRANRPEFALKLPGEGNFVVTLGHPGRYLATVLADKRYALLESGRTERSNSRMYHPRWWETGCRDELWLGQDPLIWVAPDLATHHPALVNPKRTFADLLCAAQAEYHLPLRHMSGNRSAVNSLQYMHIIEQRG